MIDPQGILEEFAQYADFARSGYFNEHGYQVQYEVPPKPRITTGQYAGLTEAQVAFRMRQYKKGK